MYLYILIKLQIFIDVNRIILARDGSDKQFADFIRKNVRVNFGVGQLEQEQ